jgi:hypothetical protein
VELVTPTLRVVSTGAAALPVALTAAGTSDLRVTTWLLGAGRAKLAGTAAVTLDPASLEWNASDATSNLDEARLLALQGAPTAALVEAASHAALSQNVAIAGGTSAIDGVAGTFFERAAAYAEIGADPAACTTQAAIALASSAPVATSCPRADLGVVDGTESCEEATARGQTAPAALRCGTLADDLAVALSGAVPADTWLTRASVLVPAGGVGTPYQVSFAGDVEASPVLTAEAIDVSECETGEGGSGPGPGSSGSGGPSLPGDPGPGSSGGVSPGGGSSGDWVYVDASGCSCSGTYEYVEYGDGEDEVPVESTSSGDDCGDDSSSSGDDCGGDTTESAEGGDDCSDDTSESGSSDDCGGDSTESSDDCSGDSTDSSGDDCSGDSSGGDSCGGDSSGGDSCSGGSGDDCSVATSRGRRARGPRLSPMVLGLLFVIAPMRRWGSRRRRAGLGPVRIGPRLGRVWAALARAVDRLDRWTR